MTSTGIFIIISISFVVSFGILFYRPTWGHLLALLAVAVATTIPFVINES